MSRDGADEESERAGGFDAAFDGPVSIPIGPELDLHTFPPREVGDIVEAYLEEVHAMGLSRVRIVHGKGRGHLRRTVHSVLEKSPFVESFTMAGEGEGSWGATIAFIVAGSVED
jgi:dsDNA-specific endonuclease/ATPase MutS2